MDHEALADLVQRSKVYALFAKIVVEACYPGPVNVISVALKTRAPNHMIDAQLPNLWRY